MAAPKMYSDEELFLQTGSWEEAAKLRDAQNNALNQYNWSQQAATTPVSLPNYENAYDAFGGKEATDSLLAQLRALGLSEDTINSALTPYFKTAAVTSPAITSSAATPLSNIPTFSEQITAGPGTTQNEFMSLVSEPASTVVGGTGNDTVTGAKGNDTVVGGTGNDTVVGAAADNITRSGLTGQAGQMVVEGDDIATQIAQLPQEYASWSRSADQKYMELIRKSDGAVLDRRTVGDFSDLDLAKIGLSFIPGAGQILAAVNIAEAVRSGNILQAAIGATGLMPGMANVNTALRVGQAVDAGNTFGALTALAGNTDLQNLTGLNTTTVGGFTAKDAMAAGNLVQAATTGNYAGVITNLGTLTGSSDTTLAGKALAILTRFQNGDTKALGDAIALSTGISSGTTKTTGTTGSTTVGDFEDTEVTRLKGLGYTKEQIQDYFRNLDNLTSNLDTAASTVVGATGNDVTLPTGVQLASTGDGVFRTDVGGVPTYAESANASSVTAPLGYKLLSTSEVENKPAGSYYDITANAWFKPDTAVTDLTGDATIQADAALFNSSLGTLDQLDPNRTSDDFAEFLKTIGITNVTQLTDSGLSNQDILDLINAGTDTVTVTGAKGNDTITGATANDGLETVTVTGAKGNDTLTGGTGNDKTTTLQCEAGFEPNADNTQCIPVVTVVDKLCGPGKVYDEDLKFCVDIQPEGCAPGFHDDGTGFCIPNDDKTTLTCEEGFEPNEAGTACIPVVEIKDKKCDPGFVYDEDLKQCVAIADEPCADGYHRDETTGLCVPNDDAKCETGYEKVNGTCVPVCQEGYVRNLATGVCEKPLDCPEGYEPNEAGTECIPKITIEECKDGKVRDPISGLCVLPTVECDPGYHLENGICVPDEEPCDTGYHRENGVCVPDECEEGYVRNLATGVCEKPLECEKGYELNEAGTECIPIIEIKSCPTGFVRDEATGKCVPIADTPCDDGYHLENGICVPDDDPCDEGYHRENGVCVPDECAEGYIRNLETGLCEKVEEKSCPPGQTRNAQGVCVPIVKTPPPPIVCPTGFKLVNGACVPIPKTTAMPTMGASGEGEKTDPIYAGGMDDFNLLATLQELLASEAPKKDDKKSKDKTKMASGGHLDDLLAEQMTVDDLLKLLR